MAKQVTNYRQLLAWQKGMALVESVFELCRKLPDEQRFGLISQMQ